MVSGWYFNRAILKVVRQIRYTTEATVKHTMRAMVVLLGADVANITSTRAVMDVSQSSVVLMPGLLSSIVIVLSKGLW